MAPRVRCGRVSVWCDVCPVTQYSVVMTDSGGRVTTRWFQTYDAAVEWARFVERTMNMTTVIAKRDMV